jgi:hypothetical protein
MPDPATFNELSRAGVRSKFSLHVEELAEPSSVAIDVNEWDELRETVVLGFPEAQRLRDWLDQWVRDEAARIVARSRTVS